MKCLDMEVLILHNGFSHVFLLVLLSMGEEDECLDVSALHMPMDQQHTVYSHTTVPKHVKHLYDGTVANESDAPLYERPHQLSDLFQVGDIVSYCREPRAGEHGLQWSVASRLIGSEKDKNSLCETQPRTCWIICDSLPVCVATDRLRPCTSAELLAFHFTQTKSSASLAADAHTQQGLIDERNSIDILTAADSSRIVENEQDVEMSEPRQITSAEKRKVDETAKELRALLPRAASPHASSSRSDTETQEQFATSAKQARTTKTGVETLQDVPFCVKRNIVSIRGMDFFK